MRALVQIQGAPAEVPVTEDVDYRTVTDVRSLETPYPLAPGETIHGITRERIEQRPNG